MNWAETVLCKSLATSSHKTEGVALTFRLQKQEAFVRSPQCPPTQNHLLTALQTNWLEAAAPLGKSTQEPIVTEISPKWRKETCFVEKQFPLLITTKLMNWVRYFCLSTRQCPGPHLLKVKNFPHGFFHHCPRNRLWNWLRTVSKEINVKSDRKTEYGCWVSCIAMTMALWSVQPSKLNS